MTFPAFTVQDAIDQNVAFPLTGAAVSPDLVGITLATTISMVAGSSQTDRDTASGQAAAATQLYLNNLRVGDPLIINDIAAAIRNSSSKILDVGAPNRQIDEIYIWRSRADASRYSRYHLDHIIASDKPVITRDKSIINH